MENTAQHRLTTLSQISNELRLQGFTEEFTITAAGLKCCSSEKVFAPEDVKILKHYRFEGDSDPGDMSILYVLKTISGLRGTVATAYGSYGDVEFPEFMKRVEEVENRNKPKIQHLV
ncbi:hypothetical protein [Cesiribacter sp. SM1]|uniref:hypothetical protein n=1 Tax=Cesiribacter sp. SM1 TaxID=2861196 RepID=UPI001CD4F39A|nr:hypothetical protein [Cesiribacter sp. SM1]